MSLTQIPAPLAPRSNATVTRVKAMAHRTRSLTQIIKESDAGFGVLADRPIAKQRGPRPKTITSFFSWVLLRGAVCSGAGTPRQEGGGPRRGVYEAGGWGVIEAWLFIWSFQTPTPPIPHPTPSPPREAG